ncbi:hypothetical protein PIB30_039094 [Stylosanthes scabra]|uniref:Uncharacterized protein n=1 Tax=Stylosanthes scabra TaxID=79078 RepID=A0ABU6YD71_9FABA|nr:hypothetical protein [Stylosanthes scabra]
MDEDGTFIFKRYKLRQEDDVRLIRKWHHHFPTIILLELLVVLVDISGSSASEVGLDTQSSRAVGTNIRRLMVDLNMPLEGSIHDSNPEVNEPTEGNDEEDFESHERSMACDPAMHSYHHDSDGEEVEVEPVTIEVEDEEEPNCFTHGQLSLTQPAITERYDHPSHFNTLNLGAMRPDVSYSQGGQMMIRQVNSRLANNLIIRKPFLLRLRHIALEELWNTRY